MPQHAPADRPPISTLVFHSPASPLLFPPLHGAGWITCHRNNPLSLLLPIVLLSCADAPLWTKEPPIHRAFLPSLWLHSRLISSIQWPWLPCFCNGQFDFSLQWRLDQFLHWEDAWQSEKSSMGASAYRIFIYLFFKTMHVYLIPQVAAWCVWSNKFDRNCRFSVSILRSG